MNYVKDLAAWLGTVAPLELSETWDNTGLLLGNTESSVSRAMTCLTLTPASVAEAVGHRADLVIAHHPLPFKPIAKITNETPAGRMLWDLASHGIAVYAPHTAWDSAVNGINASLADLLGLQAVLPMLPASSVANSTAVHKQVGAGRIGTFPSSQTLLQVAETLRAAIPAVRARAVDSGRAVQRIGIACGSGGSLLEHAIAAGCDLLLTGEATFHNCLAAEAAGVSLLMIGHFASERFAMEQLAQQIGEQFPDIDAWASRTECDPVRNL